MDLGKPLSREPSLDNFVRELFQPLDQSELYENAAYVVQIWWKKNINIVLLRRKLKLIIPQIVFVSDVLSSLDSKTDFDAIQLNLSDSTFLSSLQKYLDVLPRDRVLGNQIARARNIKTISSAIIIRLCPDEMLLSDDGREEDEKKLSSSCQRAAGLLYLSLKKFFKKLCYVENNIQKSLSVYSLRTYLISYHFCVRYFLLTLESWQEFDKLRMIKSLNESYKDMYRIILSTRSTILALQSQTNNNTTTMTTTNQLTPEERQLELHQLEEILQTTESRLNQLVLMLKDMLSSPNQDKHRSNKLNDFNAHITQLQNEALEILQLQNQNEIMSQGESQVPASNTGHSSKRANSNSPTASTVSSAAAVKPSSESSTKDPTINGVKQQHPSPSQPGQKSEHSSVAVAPPRPPDDHTSIGLSIIDSILNEQQKKIFHRLMSIITIDLEYLLYEVSLDASYSIQPQFQPPAHNAISQSPPLAPLVGSLPSALVLSPLSDEELLHLHHIPQILATQPSRATALLRKQMLRVLGDRLVCSLRTSTVHDYSQICPGMVVPVKFFGLSGESAGRATGGPSQVFSALVIAVEDGHMHIRFLSDGIQQRNIPLSHALLSSVPVDPEPFLDALSSLRQRLAEVTPSRQDFALNLQRSIDTDLIRQMLQQKVMSTKDLCNIISYLLDHVQSLQSPIHATTTENWKRQFITLCESYEKDFEGGWAAFQAAVLLLPSFFEFITDSIEEILREMANYYLSMLAPVLHTRVAPLVAHLFALKLSLSRAKVDVTARWVRRQISASQDRNACVTELSEAGIALDLGSLSATLALALTVTDTSVGTAAPRSPEGSAVGSVSASASGAGAGQVISSGTQTQTLPWHMVVLARAFVSLLRLPVRLDSLSATLQGHLPETLSWDAARLAVLRDEVDLVVLQTSMLLVVRQTLGAVCSVTTTAAEELFFRLDVLLRHPDVFLPQLVTEVTRFVRTQSQSHAQAQSQSLHSTGGVPAPVLGVGWEARLEEAVRHAVTDGHTVLALLNKRVLRLVLLGLLGLPYEHLLPGFSLTSQPVQKALVAITATGRKIFLHNIAVYGEVYLQLLQQELAS